MKEEVRLEEKPGSGTAEGPHVYDISEAPAAEKTIPSISNILSNPQSPSTIKEVLCIEVEGNLSGIDK